MKIGFCGTMSVGKTTLVKSLGELPEFKDYYVTTERSKYLKDLGIPLNTDSTLNGQTIFLAERVSELMRPKLITDRTVIDVISFAKCAKSINVLDKEAFEDYAKLFIGQYDYIFYVNPIGTVSPIFTKSGTLSVSATGSTTASKSQTSTVSVSKSGTACQTASGSSTVSKTGSLTPSGTASTSSSRSGTSSGVGSSSASVSKSGSGSVTLSASTSVSRSGSGCESASASATNIVQDRFYCDMDVRSVGSLAFTSRLTTPALAGWKANAGSNDERLT
jgi:hypothetical protein